jgi:acyl carrier protein
VNEIESSIRNFLVGELEWPGEPAELSADTPLLDGNAVDSMGIYELVTFLEGAYQIEILDEEVVPDHFGTIGALAKLVEAKR